jgi:type II secretory pathway pseudopilin PulG
MTRAREEGGIALVIVLFVILIAGLLAGAVVAGSIDTNSATNRDTRLKAALGAADAGLAVATYRLNMLSPSIGNCVTNAVVPPTTPTSGLCPQDGPESTGNGGTFSFWTSPVLASGSPCAGLQVSNSLNTITQRCVTSIGTVQGISARVQARVSAVAAIPLFPIPLFGQTVVQIGSPATVSGPSSFPVVGVGSNGSLSIPPAPVSVTGFGLAPGATVNPPTPTNAGALTPLTAAQAQIPPIDWGNSATVNEDCRIVMAVNNMAPGTGGIDPVTGATCVADTINAATGGGGGGNQVQFPSTYPTIPAIATTRALNIAGNNETLTLGGARYYFCDIVVGNQARIAIAAGIQTQIFLDSKTRNGSACPSNTNGAFSLNGSSTFITYPPATNTQLYVAGSANVDISDTVPAYLSVVAPLATVTVNPGNNNNSSFSGAIEANRVVLSNSTHFIYDGAAGTLQDAVQPLYHRTAWQQCPAAPSIPSNPTSGC